MTASASPPHRLTVYVVALVSTIAGLSLGALFSSTTDASAQDLADDVDALFAHTATGGSALKKGGSGGEWVVKFRGVPGKALGFEDRPGRREEPIRMERMLGGFFVKPGSVPPNAALSLETRRGDQTLVGVELLDGRYNRDRGVTRYRLRSLKQHGDQPLRLPRHFGDSSVFIDTLYNDCGIMTVGGEGVSLALQGANKSEHDDWSNQAWGGGFSTMQGEPPPVIGSSAGGFQMWGSSSGFARGCWNNAGYADEKGSMEFSVGNPYTGSNTWSCTSTGIYVCNGPLDWPGQYQSTVSRSGSTTTVIYAICTTDDPQCGVEAGFYLAEG